MTTTTTSEDDAPPRRPDFPDWLSFATAARAYHEAHGGPPVVYLSQRLPSGDE